MSDEDLEALFDWARALVDVAASGGFALEHVPNSSQLSGFVGWAQAVSPAVSGFAPLPVLDGEADLASALAWARALDNAARGMGADLPLLPQG